MSAHKPAKATPKSAAPSAARANAKSTRPRALAAAAGSEASHTALRLAADIDRALAADTPEFLSAGAVQALMAALCRCYAAQIEAGASFRPLPERSRVTSTDVMVTASGLLKAANLAVFELGMWQSWTGR